MWGNFIGIDECNNGSNVKRPQVDVAVSSNLEEDVITNSKKIFKKLRNPDLTEEELFALLNGREFCYVLTTKEQMQSIGAKKSQIEIYRILISQYRDVHEAFIDGWVPSTMVGEIRKGLERKVKISPVKQGDEKIKLVNLADTVAYFLYNYHNGNHNGKFDKYLMSL